MVSPMKVTVMSWTDLFGVAKGVEVKIVDGSGVKVAGILVVVGKDVAVSRIAVVVGCLSIDNTGVHPERMIATINHIANLFKRNFIVFLIGWCKEGSYGHPPSFHFLIICLSVVYGMNTPSNSPLKPGRR
jgi:hypothetical protein